MKKFMWPHIFNQGNDFRTPGRHDSQKKWLLSLVCPKNYNIKGSAGNAFHIVEVTMHYIIGILYIVKFVDRFIKKHTIEWIDLLIGSVYLSYEFITAMNNLSAFS